MDTFVLGWSTEILGNVKIVGRKFSDVSFTKGYDKHRVKTQLAAAVTGARQMLTEIGPLVNRSLASALEMCSGPGRYGLTAPLSPVVERAAIEHFKMPRFNPANAPQWFELFNYLRQAYMLIGQGVRGHLSIVDVEKAEKSISEGYVNYSNATLLDPADPDGLRFAGRGRIHLDFHWVTTTTPQLVAQTIIHEGSHKFVGTLDHAYRWEAAKYAALTPAQAKANADSIAWLAYCTYKNGSLPAP
jgi:hypothetical protein